MADKDEPHLAISLSTRIAFNLQPIVKSRHVTGGSIQPPTPDFSTSTNASHETSAHNFSTLARAAQESKKKVH